MKILPTNMRVFGASAACWAVAIALSGCGGGGGGQPPPPPTSVTQTINAASGGTINGPGGVTLTIPPAALQADTAITMALDDTGAPPLPDVLAPLDGPLIALLPHGTTFSAPVTLSMPAPASAELLVYKTNEQRDGWQALVPVPTGGRVETAITSFSHIARVSCVGPPFTNPVCRCPTPAAPMRIIGEPRDSFVLGEGGFWIFRVDAVACEPTYRWMRDGFFLPGETNQDILLNPLRASDDGTRYSVLVTDAFGRTVTSRAALLTVNAAAPVITNHPADVQVVAGANASFTAASTSSIPQTLQWKRCDPGLVCPASSAAWPDAGETSNTLTLPGVSLAANGTRVAMCATNTAGTTCSSTATLTVTATPTPPTIVTAPQPVTATAGSSASFMVAASGGSLAYAWHSGRDGVNFVAEPRCTNSATCTFSNVVVADDGLLLRVRVSNAAGQATSAPPALLTVRNSITLALARVTGGIGHSMVLGGNGRLYAWGSNDNGQLGDGTMTDRSMPGLVNGIDQVATFGSGHSQVLALRTDGSVWAWGENTFGAVGDGTTVDRSSPVAITNAGIASAVAGGRFNSYAVHAGGVAAWGTNGLGQLGNGTTVDSASPVSVSIGSVVRVAAGLGFALAARSDGSVHAWGLNNWGQLGDGTRTARLHPTPIGGVGSVVALAAGNNHALAIDADGVVFAWGRNLSGELGDGGFTTRASPAAVPLPAPAIAIAAGAGHSLALLADGRVFAWGENTFGAVGNGTNLNVATPVQVGAPLPANVVAIGVGWSHSLALDADGNVWTWGHNDSGQLGDGTRLNSNLPKQVPGLNLN